MISCANLVATLLVALVLLVGDAAAQFTCNNCTSTAGGFGLRGTSKWCQCCALDCQSSKAACISNDGWCVSRCLTSSPAVCPTPAPTPAPTTTTTLPPTVAPTPAPTTTVDPCLACASGFGVKGTTKWCQCCGNNCSGSLATCISADGWCVSRCLTVVPAVCPTNATTTTTTAPTTTTTTTTTAPTTTTTTKAANTTTTTTKAANTTSTVTTTTKPSNTTSTVTTTTKPSNTTSTATTTTKPGNTTATTTTKPGNTTATTTSTTTTETTLTMTTESMTTTEPTTASTTTEATTTEATTTESTLPTTTETSTTTTDASSTMTATDDSTTTTTTATESTSTPTETTSTPTETTDASLSSSSSTASEPTATPTKTETSTESSTMTDASTMATMKTDMSTSKAIESTTTTTSSYKTSYPANFLPWDKWAPGLVTDPMMSEIYGHIMFAGAGLILLICCIVIVCCVVRRRKRASGGDSSSKGKKPASSSAGSRSVAMGSTGKDSHLLRKGQLGIPVIVEDIIAYLSARALDTPGIFRESGKAEIVEEILDGYEMNKPMDLNKIDDVHAVAVALKTYYKKKLPQPFLDVEFAGEYLRHKDVRPAAARIRAQRAVIDRMQRAKFDEMRHLFDFLHRVTTRKAKNSMDARNLAIVFGPALFQSAFIVEATDVVVLLIQDYPALFEGSTATEEKDDGQYETSESGSPRPALGKVRALYDYEPLGNNPGEMRLDEGDVIDLIEDVDENGWAQGSVAGRVGWFPMSYCERIGAGAKDKSDSYSSSVSSSSEEKEKKKKKKKKSTPAAAVVTTTKAAAKKQPPPESSSSSSSSPESSTRESSSNSESDSDDSYDESSSSSSASESGTGTGTSSGSGSGSVSQSSETTTETESSSDPKPAKKTVAKKR